MATEAQRMQAKSSLSYLSADALRLVTSFLTVKSCYRLWRTGDALMQSKLHVGVERLVFESNQDEVLPWPHFLSYLKLLVEIDLKDIDDPYPRVVDLKLLKAPSLKQLSLRQSLLAPPLRLGTQMPNSGMGFPISRSYALVRRKTAERTPFMPASYTSPQPLSCTFPDLVTLYLHPSKQIITHEAILFDWAHLPSTHLTSLKMPSISLPMLPALASLLPLLSTLVLGSINGADDRSSFPLSLQTLEFSFGQANGSQLLIFPRVRGPTTPDDSPHQRRIWQLICGIKVAEEGLDTENQTTTSDALSALQSLPRAGPSLELLDSLSVKIHMNDRLDMEYMKRLPGRITSLDIVKTKGSLVALLPYLPKRLTRLNLEDRADYMVDYGDGVTVEAISLLPPSLTHLGLCMKLEPITAHTNHRRQRESDVEEIRPALLALPQQITSFRSSWIYFPVPHQIWPLLPPSITNIDFSASWDAESIIETHELVKGLPNVKRCSTPLTIPLSFYWNLPAEKRLAVASTGLMQDWPENAEVEGGKKGKESKNDRTASSSQPPNPSTDDTTTSSATSTKQVNAMDVTQDPHIPLKLISIEDVDLDHCFGYHHLSTLHQEEGRFVDRRITADVPMFVECCFEKVIPQNTQTLTCRPSLLSLEMNFGLSEENHLTYDNYSSMRTFHICAGGVGDLERERGKATAAMIFITPLPRFITSLIIMDYRLTTDNIMSALPQTLETLKLVELDRLTDEDLGGGEEEYGDSEDELDWMKEDKSEENEGIEDGREASTSTLLRSPSTAASKFTPNMIGFTSQGKRSLMHGPRGFGKLKHLKTLSIQCHHPSYSHVGISRLPRSLTKLILPVHVSCLSDPDLKRDDWKKWIFPPYLSSFLWFPSRTCNFAEDALHERTKARLELAYGPSSEPTAME